MANCEHGDIAGLIDHALLHPAMTEEEVDEGCRSAAQWRVASVCVKPYCVGRAREILDGSGVGAGTVVGFPHGGHAAVVKLSEARAALEEGAQELDLVINVGKARSGDWGYLEDEIAGVVDAAHQGGALVKVIFESCYLEDFHKRRLCRISMEAGADFIKTSTGYGPGGATDEDVRLMLEEAEGKMGVKAAGGIATFEHAARLRDMGVRRIGTSQTERILGACRGERGPTE